MFGIPLGAFRLSGRLDQGGMGQVWHALHGESGTPAAVKLIRENRPDLAEPFLDEVRAVARLDHPNVITVLDCGRVDAAAAAASGGRLPLGSPWMAMEYCSGGSLETHPPGDWNELRLVLAEVLGALGFAHARGVLHRDLAPANVLIATASDLRPGRKLSDFGLSTPLAHAEPGVVVGTPAYMAPEQLRGELGEEGPWTDLYQVGCLAWALATGLPPFGKDRPPAVLALAHLEVDPPAFTPRFEVPAALEGWIRSLLVKAPRRRIQRAADALTTLARFASAGPVGPRVPAQWQSARTPRIPPRLLDAGLGLHALRPVPMVGRQAERDRLWEALVEVNQAWAPRAVLVHGAAGLGKTRLVRWLAERAHELGAAHVVTFNGDAEAARARAEQGASERPVVLLLDDVHASEAAIAFAASFFTEPLGIPVLVLMTARAEGLAGAEPAAQALATLAAQIDIVRVELAPLDRHESNALLRNAMGLVPPLAHRMAECAAGNPGVAVDTLNHLLARGALRSEPTGFDAPPAVPLTLPEAALQAWDRRITEVERHFAADASVGIQLEAAAVLGAQVDEAEWEAVVGDLGHKPAPMLIERLVRERLAAPVEVPGDALVWRFAHAYVREALLARARAAGRLRTLHLAAARRATAGAGGVPLEERLATHHTGAGEPEAALTAWLQAAERRAMSGDWPSVLGVAVRATGALAAMAGAPGDARRLAVEVWKARAVLRGASGLDGRTARADAARRLDRVIDEAQDRGWTEVLVQALLARAEVDERLADGEAIQARLGRASAAAWAFGEPALTARVDHALALVALRRRDLDTAAGRLELTRVQATREGHRPWAVEVKAAQAELHRLADQSTTAERLAREVLAMAGPRSHRPATAAALAVLAEIERARGRKETAIDLYRRALDLHHDPEGMDALTARVHLGALLLSHGKESEGCALLSEGREAAERAASEGHRAWMAVVELPAALRRGDEAFLHAELASARVLARWGLVDADAAAALATVASVLTSSGGRNASLAAVAAQMRQPLVPPPPPPGGEPR
jgi:hypothetical protein